MNETNWPINPACAQKDAEIARLKDYGEQKSIALQVKDQRIAELEKMNDELAKGLAKALLEVTERDVANETRIAELEPLERLIVIQTEAYGRAVQESLQLEAQNKAQAVLLDRVPHWRDEELGTPCVPDCPACAWAKLKEAK